MAALRKVAQVPLAVVDGDRDRRGTEVDRNSADSRSTSEPSRVVVDLAPHAKADPAPAEVAKPDTRSLWRKRLFGALAGTAAMAGLAWGSWWYLVGSHYISTDDAYVNAQVAAITPQEEGTILDVRVVNTQHVHRGDVLVDLDPADAQIAFDQAQANYAQAIQRVQQYFANADAAQAQVVARQADATKAQLDFNRRARLLSLNAIAEEQVSTARDARDAARASLVAARQQLVAQEALIKGTDVVGNPEVLAAKAALDKARLSLSRTVIRAPIDGIVGQKDVQVGQHIESGAQLMTVVPVSQAYVDANFKESQIQKVRSGQPVTLTSDTYGSGVVFHGQVVGLEGGTGSAFALIPAQNATGNWIKVVQRVPVRIALDPAELSQHPLRVGLSMDAKIRIVD